MVDWIHLPFGSILFIPLQLPRVHLGMVAAQEDLRHAELLAFVFEGFGPGIDIGTGDAQLFDGRIMP